MSKVKLKPGVKSNGGTKNNESSSRKAEFDANESSSPLKEEKVASSESKDMQAKIIEMGQMIEKKVNQIEEYKRKKEKEIEDLKTEKEMLSIKLQRKDKEFEALNTSLILNLLDNNSIAIFRKENKNLAAKLEIGVELGDIHNSKEEVIKLRAENLELK